MRQLAISSMPPAGSSNRTLYVKAPPTFAVLLLLEISFHIPHAFLGTIPQGVEAKNASVNLTLFESRWTWLVIGWPERASSSRQYYGLYTWILHLAR